MPSSKRATTSTGSKRSPRRVSQSLADEEDEDRSGQNSRKMEQPVHPLRSGGTGRIIWIRPTLVSTTSAAAAAVTPQPAAASAPTKSGGAAASASPPTTTTTPKLEEAVKVQRQIAQEHAIVEYEAMKQRIASGALNQYGEPYRRLSDYEYKDTDTRKGGGDVSDEFDQDLRLASSAESKTQKKQRGAKASPVVAPTRSSARLARRSAGALAEAEVEAEASAVDPVQTSVRRSARLAARVQPPADEKKKGTKKAKAAGGARRRASQKN